MKILTDYYLFVKIATKSKTRMDCTNSTHSYPEFELRAATKVVKGTEKRDAIDVDDIIIYIGDVPSHFGGDISRKADKSISIKGKNLSSIYTPDITRNIAVGDFQGTDDALLFLFHNFKIVDGVIQPDSKFEVFVARGKAKDRMALYNLLADGELDEEMEMLRGEATPLDRERECGLEKPQPKKKKGNVLPK